MSNTDLLARLIQLESDVAQQKKIHKTNIRLIGDELHTLHMATADLMAQKGDYAEAVPHYRAALRLKPNDLATKRACAGALGLNGEYAEAIKLYQQCLSQKPTARLKELKAATHASSGDVETALEILRETFRDAPLDVVRRQPESGPQKPEILKIMGLDKTYCVLAKNSKGRARTSYRGGHFATKHLLDPKPFALSEWTIALDNINQQAGKVPKADIYINTIADADTEKLSLLSLNTFLQDMPSARVINRPEHVLRTTRENNYQRFKSLDGLTFARTERLSLVNQLSSHEAHGDNRARAEAFMSLLNDQNMTYPLILRETGTHTARTVELVQTPEQAMTVFSQPRSEGTEFYAIEFIDQRYEGSFYNKKRFFCIDGMLYPVVSHVDAVWNVHGSNRRTLMTRHPWMQEQERRFVTDPINEIGTQNYDLLASLYETVKLDFFGFDFTIQDDGSILMFELNASMRHSDDHSSYFKYLSQNIQNITDAFQTMVVSRLHG